ncbi:HepT-like ribonuclease domain-containing protein [Microbacterium suaedae]|uniref:HepT-like ribonuclease domain-containing protein n=1 Tax=Microbacterium suaedae TaxID=2067813 RepID=UPI0022B7848F|nr:HepT-like ribonuclease domain-containing protein [Microbacterium suaedae]
MPDLREIIGTRNVIARGYDVVDQDIIWSLLRSGIPALAEVLKALLEEAPAFED